MSKALHSTKDLPVKLFINCKNSKRKTFSDRQPSSKILPDVNQGQDSDDEYGGDASPTTNDEILSREEV